MGVASVAPVLLAIFMAIARADNIAQCHTCYTNVAMSTCHVRPAEEPGGVTGCQRNTKRCVIERVQDKDGAMISVRRRCANQRESRFSFNRCAEQEDGTFMCLSYCRGELCNQGTGRLYTTTSFWDYDGPDYADYVFDPEQAVLDPGYGGEEKGKAVLHAKHVQELLEEGKSTLEGGSGVVRGSVGLLVVVTMVGVVFG